MNIRAFVALTAATVVLTLYFWFPVPVLGVHITLADAIVIFAGLGFGPIVGMGVGGLGGCIADLLGSHPEAAPVAFVVKGVAGLLAGIIRRESRNPFVPLAAAAVAATWMVIGYFTAEATVLGLGLDAARAGLPTYIAQGIAAVVVAYGLYLVFGAVFRRKDRNYGPATRTASP